MNISGRSIIAVIAGTILAFALVLLAQYLGNMFAPEVYDVESEEVLIPLGSTIALFMGWFVGSFGGSWLAMRVSNGSGPGWIVAGAVIGAAVYRAFSLGEDFWVIAAGFVIPMLAAWLASRTASLAR